MKRKLKGFICTLALAATSAFALSGCALQDKIDEWTCDHKYKDVEITKEATCSDKGEKLVECTECGKETTKAIAKLAHTEITVEYKAPTCTEAGNMAGTVCSVCEEVITATVIPALGHKAVADEAVKATCTASGLTEGSHCERCDEVIVKQETVAATAHKLVTVEEKAATCVETGLTEGMKCEYCGEIAYGCEEISTVDHEMDNTKLYCVNCDYSLATEGLEISNGRLLSIGTATNEEIIYIPAYDDQGNEVTGINVDVFSEDVFSKLESGGVLKEVYVPLTVRSVSEYAFSGDCIQKVVFYSTELQFDCVGCKVFGLGVTEIYFYGTTPPTFDEFMTEEKMSSFIHRSDVKIYVPAESLEAYKTAELWSVYADHIFAIPEA